MKEFRIEKLRVSKELYLAMLLCCSDMSEKQRNRAKQLAQEVDIEEFEKVVIVHRIYGLVMENILGIKLFPEGTCKRLKQAVQEHMFHAMCLAGVLVKIVNEFQKEQIPMLLMKGPVLGWRLYKNMTVRVSNDLDILVRWEDFEKAAECLKNMGFEQKQSYTKKQQKQIYKTRHHIDFMRNDGVHVEIHWKMSETMDVYLEDLWTAHREISFAGVHVPVPDEISEFLFLVHHGIGHGFYRIKWLLDIVEIVRKNEIRWEDVFARAKKENRLFELITCLLICYILEAFELADTDFDKVRIGTISSGIIVEINDGIVLERELNSARRMIDAMIPVVLRHNDYTEELGGTAEFIRYFHMYEEELDKWEGRTKAQRFFLRLKPMARDFEKFKLDDKIYFLYYILRPLYWIKLKIDSLRKK